jgi:hypothetical protein
MKVIPETRGSHLIRYLRFNVMYYTNNEISSDFDDVHYSLCLITLIVVDSLSCSSLS